MRVAWLAGQTLRTPSVLAASPWCGRDDDPSLSTTARPMGLAVTVLSELRARMTRSEAPSLLPCLRRRHFGDQCMPAPDEASSLLGQGDDLAAATASAQVLAELLKRRAEACR